MFPLALQIPKQVESAPLAPPMTSEAPPQHPPSAAQPEQGVAQETLKGSSSGKVTEAPQFEAASHDFEKQLALVTIPIEGSLQEKEKRSPPEAADQASKPKLQIKLKP